MTKKRLFILALFASLLLLLALAACKKATDTEYNIDSSSCSGCADCVRVCPNDAIYLDASGKASIDQSKCTKCGKCVTACPNSAIY